MFGVYLLKDKTEFLHFLCIFNPSICNWVFWLCWLYWNSTYFSWMEIVLDWQI